MSIIKLSAHSRQSWATTHWSTIANLERRKAPTWEASWEYLVDTYRSPMERYVRRVLSRTTGRKATTDEAAEIVQDFLATCVEKDWLSRADRHRGRFRAYVQTLLRRYTYRHLKHAYAQRRRPAEGRQLLPLLEDEARTEFTPEEQAELDEFDRSWMKVAVDRALARLGEEHLRYQAVMLDLIATDGQGSPDLAERVEARPQQLAVLRHRSRQRFAKLLVEELANTVGNQEAFEEELRALDPYVP